MQVTMNELHDLISEATTNGNRYMIRPGIDVLVKHDNNVPGWRLHRLKKVTYFTEGEIKQKPEDARGHWTFVRKGWLLSATPWQVIDLTKNWNEPAMGDV